MTEVLAKALEVTVLQYINISNQQAVHRKLIQCDMSIISQKIINEYSPSNTFQSNFLEYVCKIHLSCLCTKKRGRLIEESGIKSP